MKNTINLLIALMLLLTNLDSNSLLANPIIGGNGLIVKIAPSESARSFELRMANLGKQFTKVKVIDVWGYTLLSQMVTKKDGYSSRIDLQNLPKGDYLLHVEHPNGTFNHAFHLGGESVTFFNTINKDAGFVQLTGHKTSTATIPSQFTVNGNDINVKVEGLNGKQVNAHICNLNGKVYLRKKIKNADAMDEQFETARLRNGEYMLVIRTRNKTVIQPFAKTDSSVELKNTLVSKSSVGAKMEIHSQR